MARLVAVATLLAFAAGGCATGTGAGGADAAVDPMTPRYVLLAAGPQGQPVAFARVILPAGSGCPVVEADDTIVLDGDPAPPTRIPMAPRGAEARFGFPQVCEAAVPFGVPISIRFGDGARLSLPSPEPDPSRILAMGDTGCGDCPSGQPAAELAALAAAAAAEEWDLILHMGDYNYRGTPSKVTFADGSQDWAYDAGDGTDESESCLQADGSDYVSQNAPGNSPRDSWSAWDDDFFAPAGELLWAAPWVFARGNHELCSRAGPGWFYFLDASSELPEGGGEQRSCPAADPPSSQQIDNVVMIPPYVVDLGDLRLAVLDSANACDGFALPDMADFTGAYAAQLGDLQAMLGSGGAPAWLMTHRPVWGVASYEADESTPCLPGDDAWQCINQTLQYAAVHGFRGGAWPAAVDLLLAGHMHHFQALTFGGRRAPVPPQLVIGNGGVELSGTDPVGSFTLPVEIGGRQRRAVGVALADQVDADGFTVSAFGFLEMELAADGSWQATLINTGAGVELAACSSAQAAAGRVCDLKVTALPPSGGD